MKLKFIVSLFILVLSFNSFAADKNQCRIEVKENYYSEGFTAQDLEFIGVDGELLWSEHRSLFFAYRESLGDKNSKDRKYFTKLIKVGCESLVCVDENGAPFQAYCPTWFK